MINIVRLLFSREIHYVNNYQAYVQGAVIFMIKHARGDHEP